MACIYKRTRANGEVSYQARIRLKGGRHRSKTFRKRVDAKKWAEKTSSEMRERRNFPEIRGEKRTVGQAIARYREEILPLKGARTAYDQAIQLAWWDERLGQTILALLTTAAIVEQRSTLISAPNDVGRSRSCSTANRYIAVLKHVQSVCVSEWEWLETSPSARIKSLPEPRGRVRVLDKKEKVRLLSACSNSRQKSLYPIVVIALSTGMRRSEILSLKWQDVCFKHGRLIVQDSKNGEKRRVPLKGHAAEVLSQHARVRRIDTDYVFPSCRTLQPIDISKCWADAVKKAGVEDFRFHDLRHTAASYFAMNGATSAEIAEILGHRSLSMVKRYTHFLDSHVSAVVEQMNRELFG